VPVVQAILADTFPPAKRGQAFALFGVAVVVAPVGFEIEISAQIARARRWRIYEVGISYYGRTYEEGKKINWLDGLKALVYLIKFRIRTR
jgi:MFS family permease